MCVNMNVIWSVMEEVKWNDNTQSESESFVFFDETA